MRKRTVLATFLLNAGLVASLGEGEARVREAFAAAYPALMFPEWDEDLAGPAAAALLRHPPAPPPDVGRLIEELW